MDRKAHVDQDSGRPETSLSDDLAAGDLAQRRATLRSIVKARGPVGHFHIGRNTGMIQQKSNPQSPQVVSLADEDSVKQILLCTVFGLWDIVNDLPRLRLSKREHYRVTNFGSARAQPSTYAYDEVKRIARVLAEMSFVAALLFGWFLSQSNEQRRAPARSIGERKRRTRIPTAAPGQRSLPVPR